MPQGNGHFIFFEDWFTNKNFKIYFHNSLISNWPLSGKVSQCLQVTL